MFTRSREAAKKREWENQMWRVFRLLGYQQPKSPPRFPGEVLSVHSRFECPKDNQDLSSGETVWRILRVWYSEPVKFAKRFLLPVFLFLRGFAASREKSDLSIRLAGGEWREWELNPRPKAYESSALPLSYPAPKAAHTIFKTQSPVNGQGKPGIHHPLRLRHGDTENTLHRRKCCGN